MRPSLPLIWYASTPCSPMSSPSISSSLLTLKPNIALMTYHATILTTKVKTPMPTTPIIAETTSSVPPPNKSPSPVIPGANLSSAKNPKASVPNPPFTRCTDRAPTGSSSFSLSNIITANTTSTPAISPMISELTTLTYAHDAVMATRPASVPLSIIERSGLRSMIHAVSVAVSVAAAAAVLVVSAILAIAPASAAIVEPGLNPNHPSQRMSAPSVAVDILCPGIGLTLPSFVNLPSLGPRTMTPASAAQPPIEWTTVEPAKPNMPALASQPPPHIQWPPTG